MLYMLRRVRSRERGPRTGRLDGIDEIPTLRPQLSRSDADVQRLDESVAPTAPF
jgi:hypothetical protein